MAAVDRTPLADELVAQWVQEHGLAVRGYLFGMVRRDDVVDDLYQEVFRRAWEARRRYREQGHARAYLLRIADRLVFDRSRKPANEITVQDDIWRQCEPHSDTEEPLEAALAAESRQQLQTALEQLTPAQKRVLLLRYYGNLEFRQIAKLLDCPVNTALSHCRRGLEALRTYFGENSA